jgi:pimeloyl-ACP methyl ester carboxylesterase/DNA-binding CsgD family transcriptional regulator
MPSPAIRYATTSDGVDIAYIRVGEGPPIVFAANTADAQAYFIPDAGGMTDGLANAGWEIVLHDNRGVGASEREVGGWSFEARIKDLEAVLSRVRFDRFVLAGIDHGSPAAIAYAARNPERVSHLVLLCAWAKGADYFALPAVRFATSPPPTTAQEWKVYTNIIGGVLTEFVDPNRQRQIAEAIHANTSAARWNEMMAAVEATDVTDLLPRVCAPTLVLHDPKFPFASLDLCRSVAAGIREARLEVMTESFMMGPRQDQTVAAIDRFLRGRATSDQAAQSLPRNHATLTPREREVLRLIAAGHPNKTIALRLGMSERTAARHITNLYAKIGVQSKAAATAYAIRRGLT